MGQNIKNKKMIRMLYPMQLLWVALCLLIGNIATAQVGYDGGVERTQVASLSGFNTADTAAPLQVNYVKDNNQEVSKTIKNIITLSLIEETPNYVGTDFSANVRIRIYYGHQNFTQNFVDTSLTVTYSNTANTKYTAKAYISFDNIEYMRVTILKITAPAINSYNTRGMLRLENCMQVTRYYQLANNVLPQSLSAVAGPGVVPDELNVNWQWPGGSGNNYTQLEWTWLEDELQANYLDASNNFSTALLLKNNATRVDLPLNKVGYSIPLFYDGVGKLYYRVRAVNYTKTGTEQVGPWSAVNSFAFGGHNNSLNWQVNTSYAEDGKHKTVIQYFDGSLRNRQTVTKDNTTNTTISAETFYDGQGRPAIQILPAPGINNIVAYTQNLNLFNGQAANTDPTKYFDLTPNSDPRNSITRGLSDNSGTAQYYSPSNPEINDSINKNIPDADSFPYTVTRYMPDATGRILSQSGVGPAFKMGSGHETKYYYGTAPQEILDGLFGTEVGDNSHYFENMVEDPNGQMSVNYVDMHGRTIATALTGDAPATMDSLDNGNPADYTNQAGTMINRNLLGSNIVKSDGSIESTSNILVPGPDSTDFTFSYNFPPNTLQIPTCGGVKPFNCIYNLQISVTDQSGIIPPIVWNYNNVNTATVTQKIKLYVGSYTVRKTLSIDQSTLQQYDSVYTQTGVGVCNSLQTIIDSVQGVMETQSGCNNPAVQMTAQACLDTLGATFADFERKYAADLGLPSVISLTPTQVNELQTTYAADVANCNKLSTTISHTLDNIKQEMLADMIPYSGQYAQDPTVAAHSSMYDKYNIFNPENFYNEQPIYLRPTNGVSVTVLGNYLTQLGDVDQTIMPILPNTTPDQFEHLFQYSWANALLPYHPEYKQLLFAENNLQPSYDWRDNFSQITTYSQVPANYFTNIVASDPFFSVSTADAATMTKYVTQQWQGGESLWQLAYTGAVCNSIADPTAKSACIASPLNPPYSGLTTDQSNNLWIAFQSLYNVLRDSMVNAYIQKNALNPDTADLVHQGYSLHFVSDYNLLAQQLQAPGIFQTTPGTMPDETTYIDSAASFAKNVCLSYVPNWQSELLQCSVLAGEPTATQTSIINQIISRMVAVCNQGTDDANPNGASSIPPGAVPANTYNDTSFEEIVNAVYAANGIGKDQYCNPYVIISPKPYDKNPLLYHDVTASVDSCNCKQYAQIVSNAVAAGYNPSVLSSLNAYLQNEYGDTLSVGMYGGLQHCGCTKHIDSTKTPAGTYHTVYTYKTFYCTSSVILKDSINGTTTADTTTDQIEAASPSGILASYPYLGTFTDIKFDSISTIPANAVVDSAVMNLYADPAGLYPPNYTTAHSLPATGLPQTIVNFTSWYIAAGDGPYNWNESSSVSTLEGIESGEQVFNGVPPIAAPFQDLHLDARLAVGFWYSNRNTGAAMTIGNFTTGDTLRYVSFCSNKYPDVTKRPTLIIKYSQEVPDTLVIYDTACLPFHIDTIHVVGKGPNVLHTVNKVFYATTSVIIRDTTAAGIGIGIADTTTDLIEAVNTSETIPNYPYFGSSTFFKFDSVSTLSEDLTISSAVMNLYATPTGLYPPAYLDAHSVRSDGLPQTTLEFVSLYPSNWNESSSPAQILAPYQSGGQTQIIVPYNPAPPYNPLLPPISDPFQDIHMDVAQAVHMWIYNGNAGAQMYINNFSPGDSLRYVSFCSNKYPDVTKRPTLDVTYQYSAPPDSVIYDTTYSSSSFALSTPQPLPEFLKCGYDLSGTKCYTCAALSTLTAQYKAVFAGTSLASAPDFTDTDLDTNAVAGNKVFASYLNYKTGMQYSWLEYAQAVHSSGCDLGSGNPPGITVICRDDNALTDTAGLNFVTPSPCQQADAQAINAAQNIYQLRLQNLLASFQTAYLAQTRNVQEQFTALYITKEYHYTLYYYDLAGNLVKTVPPKGVHPDFTNSAAVEAAKQAGIDILMPHTYATDYRYNTLGTAVEQKTPDANTSSFWYDALGRIVVSQNAQQAIDGKYSYTVYDPIGRIIEVGQKPTTTAMTQIISQNNTALQNWLATGSPKEQITYTVYDIPSVPIMGTFITQNNLRNRISYTYTKNLESDPFQYAATYYTYDVHGNVDTLLQDYRGLAVMTAAQNRFKLIAYNYDLVSGKIDQVDYQPGQPDAFHHRYNYDALNRLTDVYTSCDSIVWDRDAAYSYYKHGPLARTVIGQLQVQGIDYSYTLQGWLKGINQVFGGGKAISNGTGCAAGTSLDNLVVNNRTNNQPVEYDARNSISFVPGFGSNDAGDYLYTNLDPTLPPCVLSNPSTQGSDVAFATELPPVANDAYGISLHYYPGDYKSIDGSVSSGILGALSDAAPLYNSNIAAMAVNIPKLGNPLVYNYHYDQLNRITRTDTYNGLNPTTGVFTPVQINDYKERLSYDPNGNIMSYLRNGASATNLAMDDLHYQYNATTNQLNHVADNVSSANYTEDIDNQNTDNYKYDAIGNLKSDVQEGISAVNWTVYGKISSIKKTDGTIITYTYDASGNRLSKTIMPTTGIADITCYVRDANGGVMSIYEKTDSLRLTEADIYGISRLGLVKTSLNMQHSTSLTVALATEYGNGIFNSFTRGIKLFELSNHSSNVLATVDDKKLAVDINNDDVTDYYNADIITANDYYSGGMQMPGRSFAVPNNNYRYGFNGKEKDPSITSGDYDFGARIYDGRIGRWLSIDPLQKKYPDLTPYNFAANNPILFIDPDGKIIRIYYADNKYIDYTPGMTLPKGLPAYVSQVAAAITYNMNTEKGTQIWSQLADSKAVLVIRQYRVTLDNQGAGIEFTPKLGQKTDKGEDLIGEIDWDPNADLPVEEQGAINQYIKGYLSPSTILLHEGGHAIDADDALTLSKTDPTAIDKYNASGSIVLSYDEQYGTKGERKNIVERENVYVREINAYEQKNGGTDPSYQPIRNNHEGSPNTTYNQNDIQIDVNKVHNPAVYNEWRRDYPQQAKNDNDGIILNLH